MGILSAIAVPKVGGLITNLRIKAAGDKLLDDIRYIYNYAVSQRDTTWLVVDMANNSYGLYSGPSAAQRVLIVDPTTNQPGIIDLDERFPGVVISSVNFGGSQEVFFDWWGTPSSGGQLVLNNNKTITVAPGTGYVYETE
jgi:Tfp pilus assembly protein FimT